jgi:hypothetical protein
MKKIICLLFLAASIYSCKPKEDPVPAKVIGRDTMVNLLADLHLAEAKMLVSGKEFNSSVLKSAYLQNVLLKAKIDTARFSESFQFYATHPALFSSVYDDVITEISKRQATFK